MWGSGKLFWMLKRRINSKAFHCSSESVWGESVNAHTAICPPPLVLESFWINVFKLKANSSCHEEFMLIGGFLSPHLLLKQLSYAPLQWNIVMGH